MLEQGEANVKGIIVEIKGRYAVALTANGSFVKTKSQKGFRVGEEAEFTPAYGIDKRALTRVASIAAAFVFVLGASWGVYAMPFSYVDVDINPSVELTSNIFDRIIKVEALNTDGEKITDDLQLNNKKIDDGISLLLDEAVSEGYLKKGDLDAVMFSVTAGNKEKSEKLEAKLKTKVEKEFSSEDEHEAVMVEKYTADKQKAAREKGISPGKLSLIEKLIEQKPEMSVDTLKNEPVKEIVKSLQQAKQEDKVKDNNKDKSKDNGTDNSKGNNSSKNKDKNQSSLNNSTSVKSDRASAAASNGKGKVNKSQAGSTANKASEATAAADKLQGKTNGNSQAGN